jgi:hypothetical protein
MLGNVISEVPLELIHYRAGAVDSFFRGREGACAAADVSAVADEAFQK